VPVERQIGILEEKTVATDITEQLAKQLQIQGIENADQIARDIAAGLGPVYGEDDLRDAFRSGWHERNRNPGLKRQARSNVHNTIMNAIGGGRHLEQEYVPDKRTYHNSIWANSGFRKDLAKGSDTAD
jgi:hypothetical protein